MHKPVRPKSAKGKSRTVRPTITRTVVQQHENRSNERNSAKSDQATHSKSSDQRETIMNSHSMQSTQFSGTSSSHDFPSSSQASATPVDLFPEITRPTSSLSKYRILPSISGTNTPSSGGDALCHQMPLKDEVHDDMDLLTEQAQLMILDSAIQRSVGQSSSHMNGSKRKVVKGASSSESKRQKFYQTQSIFSPSKYVIAKNPPKPMVPTEPGPDSQRLLLALKLPDGTRVERHFSPDTQLIGILAYAHSQYPIIPISQCNLFRMDVVPKKLLDKTDLTLKDVNIKNRTVLYVEEKEDN